MIECCHIYHWAGLFPHHQQCLLSIGSNSKTASSNFHQSCGTPSSLHSNLIVCKCGWSSSSPTSHTHFYHHFPRTSDSSPNVPARCYICWATNHLCPNCSHYYCPTCGQHTPGHPNYKCSKFIAPIVSSVVTPASSASKPFPLTITHSWTPDGTSPTTRSTRVIGVLEMELQDYKKDNVTDPWNPPPFLPFCPLHCPNHCGTWAPIMKEYLQRSGSSS